MSSRSFRLLLLAAASSIALASCSSAPAPAPTTSGSASPSAAATTPAELTPVSLALSWTPNTDYTGVYVAQQKGYYAAHGIDLTILPYASTAPETLVASGAADFGFSYQAGVTYARAAGQDVVSVFAPDQKGTYAIGVAADRAEPAGAPGVQPRQADEIDAVLGRHASLVLGPSGPVEHRRVEPAEIRREADAPDDAGDAGPGG